jgi:hypothetical protein
VAKGMRAKVGARDVAAEIIRRAKATAGNAEGRDSLPYVVRLSDPPTAHEQLQLAACHILRQPIAIVPATCLTAQEWSEKYGALDRA